MSTPFYFFRLWECLCAMLARRKDQRRPSSAELEATIERRRAIVAQLAAHEVDTDLDLLERLFGAIEGMAPADRLVIIFADKTPAVILKGKS